MSRKTIDGQRDAFTVRAYPRVLRWASGGLLLASGLALPFLLVRVLVATDPPMTPPMVLRAFLALSALPAIAAWLVQRALAAELTVDRDALQLRVGGQSFDVPLGAIAAVEPWRVPLPQAGFDLRLASGERFALGIGTDDPRPLIERLAPRGARGAPPAAAAASREAAREQGPATHPTVLYASVKHRAGRLDARWLAVKFPLFGALVAAVVFNAHQHIAYGGTFGQYYLDGLWPYLRTFAVYWATVTIYLVLYASAWRWVAELVAWFGANGGEHIATRTRRLLELACRVAYYAGVPLMLAARFAD